MSTSEKDQDRWERCPPGALTQAVRGVQARQRDRRRARLVAVAGSAVVVLFAAAMIAQQFDSSSTNLPTMTKITCAKVKSLWPDYVAGKLEAAVTDQVDSHLDRCPHCRERFKDAKDETALPGQRATDPLELAMRT